MGPIAESAMHTHFLPKEQRNSFIAERGKKSYAHFAGILDKELEGPPSLMGDKFTAADIVVGYTLFVSRLFQISVENCPNLDAYFDRLAARPAFVKASS